MPIPSARKALLEGVTPEEEAVFFTHLLLPSGAYKTTFPGRLRDLDRLLARLLAGRESVRILDVGVSSGVTTADMIDAFEASGLHTKTTAADLVVRGRLVSTPLLGEVLVDGRGRFLQFAGPLGVRMRPYPEGAKKLAAAALDGIARTASVNGSRGEQADLISRRLREIEACETVEHDVLQERPEWRGRFDLIRAANLLNRKYFEPEAIRRAIGFLRTALAPGGLLAICRTDIETEQNHATIFRLNEAGTLEPAERLGDGSEVEDLAL